MQWWEGINDSESNAWEGVQGVGSSVMEYIITDI